MKKAFSLVELSIVLVILGLLTGGILAGQSLIRAAELRSVSTEYQRHISSFYTFRDKYFALPGDMKNATAFWGEAHADPATCVTTSSADSSTCDGNGDGSIAISTGSNEYFRAWQHLANAGLIEGSYTGVTGSGSTYDAIIGVNSPASKLNNAGFGVYNPRTAASGETEFFEGYYAHRLHFGAKTTNGVTDGPVLKPEEAWNLDTKIDDGIPGIGTVRSYESASTTTPNCTTTILKTTSEYNLTNSSILCSLVFTPGF